MKKFRKIVLVQKLNYINTHITTVMGSLRWLPVKYYSLVKKRLYY